jgi:hypothetical protein
MEAAAIYATKHSTADTRAYLAELMEQKDRGFSGSDFTIKKDEDSNATVSITYYDEVRIFGTKVTEFEFTIEKFQHAVERQF